VSFGDFLLKLAALATAVAGVITAWLGVRKTKRAGQEDCDAKLKETRVEAEEYASKLHEERMAKFKLDLATLAKAPDPAANGGKS
jgi:hypothetical protein